MFVRVLKGNIIESECTINTNLTLGSDLKRVLELTTKTDGSLIEINSYKVSIGSEL